MAEKSVKNRIKAVGVELEGGWTHAHGRTLDIHIEHDGSVAIPDPRPPKRLMLIDPLAHTPAEVKALKKELEQWRMDNLPAFKGEIPSPPLEPLKVGEFIAKYYPKFVNETCGMHVHMSFFYPINYQRLMTPVFTTDMVKGLLEWAEEQKLPPDHAIWPRIQRKDHPHCAHVYLGETQSKAVRKDYNSRGTNHSRYTALNYCYAMPTPKGGTRRTVECRLLPMMETPDLATSAVMEVLNITNRFLARQRTREAKLDGTVRRSGSVNQARRLSV